MGVRFGVIALLIFVFAMPVRAQVIAGASVRASWLPQPFKTCSDATIGTGGSVYAGVQLGRLSAIAELNAVGETTSCAYDAVVPIPGSTPAFGYSTYNHDKNLETVVARIAYRPFAAPIDASVGGGFELGDHQPVFVTGLSYRAGKRVGFRAGADALWTRVQYETFFWNGSSTQRITDGYNWHATYSVYGGAEFLLFK